MNSKITKDQAQRVIQKHLTDRGWVLYGDVAYYGDVSFDKNEWRALAGPDGGPLLLMSFTLRENENANQTDIS